jgi:hypothetical protein
MGKKEALTGGILIHCIVSIDVRHKDTNNIPRWGRVIGSF